MTSGTPKKPRTSATDVTGDFDEFKTFMRRLVAVPHSEIKSKLDAEKKRKAKKRKLKASASPDPASASTSA